MSAGLIIDIISAFIIVIYCIYFLVNFICLTKDNLKKEAKSNFIVFLLFFGMFILSVLQIIKEI